MERKRIPIDQIKEQLFELRATEDEEELASLQESIQQIGMLNPIVVQKAEDGYKLIAGARRLEALKRANITECDVVVLETDDKNAFAIAMSENIARKQFSPGEIILALQEASKVFNLPVEELIKQTGLSDSQQKLYLRLMNADEPIVQALVEDKISLRVAYEIIKVPSKKHRLRYLDFAIRDGATAQAIRSWKAQEDLEIQQEFAREQGLEVNLPNIDEIAEKYSRPPPLSTEQVFSSTQSLPLRKFTCMKDSQEYTEEEIMIVTLCKKCFTEAKLDKFLEL